MVFLKFLKLKKNISIKREKQRKEQKKSTITNNNFKIALMKKNNVTSQRAHI